MVNKPLDMRFVYKRDRALSKMKSLKENNNILEEEMIDLENVKSNSLYKMRVENYLDKCVSYKGAINLLENLYRDNKFDMLENATQHIINHVIPCVGRDDLNSCIDCIKESDIGDINKDRLVESAKIYKSIDRIKKNHINLSKRFSLESFSNRAKSDKFKYYTICEAVDTYKLSPFIKMNIALEEITYLSFLEGAEVDNNSLVENVSTYFLLRNDNTSEDIDEFKRAIKESKVIPMESDANVKYLMNENAIISSYWKDRLHEWMIDSNKSTEGLVNIIKENINDISALKEMTSILEDYISINGLDINSISTIMESISDITGNEAHNIIDLIKENNIENSEELVESLSLVWEADINDEVYADGHDSPESFSCEDIDTFKMHNLIVDAQDIGEFLDQMEKTSAKESPLNIEKVDGIDDINRLSESNISDYIDSHGHISIKLASYNYNGSISDINKYLESNINCINNILYNRNSRSYYILGENSFDIYLRSRYFVDLTPEMESAKGFTSSEKKTICDLAAYSEAIESLVDSPLAAIEEKLNDKYYAATISAEEAALVCEVLAPYNSIGEEGLVDNFIKLCKEEANPSADYIKYLCDDIAPEPFNIYEDHNMRLNFCAYDIMNLDEDMVERASGNLRAAVNDLNPLKKKNNVTPEKISGNNKASTADKQPKEINNKAKSTQQQNDNNDQQSQKKVPEKKPLSLNDLKLAWKGVMSKAKGVDAKQKEMCRDIDMEFNNLCKNIESTFSTDHREEIITGQVNRSLSKIIKTGIALAGVGVVGGKLAGLTLASSAVIPAIGAVALFAKSAYTTNKEKRMILDEIDIELQVLEREISRAESSGSTKKYRALLTIQKNLQRRRQEIYYGLAKHGSRIPMQPVQGLRRE